MIFSITAKPFFNTGKPDQTPPIVATLELSIEQMGVKEAKSIVIPMGMSDTQLDIAINTAVDLFKNYVRTRYAEDYKTYSTQKEKQSDH